MSRSWRCWDLGFEMGYPLVNIQKAIEHGHRNSGFTHEKWWFSIVTLVYQRVPQRNPWIRVIRTWLEPTNRCYLGILGGRTTIFMHWLNDCLDHTQKCDLWVHVNVFEYVNIFFALMIYPSWRVWVHVFFQEGRAPKNQEVLRQTLSICQAGKKTTMWIMWCLGLSTPLSVAKGG